ncbi:MAG: TonB-dependent receptor, partial [Bacteroidia bacterium]|nr:TonB-dependent receptor [Bacteroidia bacterium]
MICKNIKYILILFLVILSAKAMSQRDTTITQEVEVVKAFKPTISDANKINEMPKIEESAPQKPTFSYSIFSQPIYDAFSVNP